MSEVIKKDKKNKVTKTVAKRGDKKPTTKAGRIFRGPLFWIVFAIIAVSVFGQISGAGSAFTKVNTSQILDAIAQSEVKSATVVDKDQKIRVELKPGRTIDGAAKVEASYVIRQEPTIIDALSANPPVNGWNIEVPKTPLFLVSYFR
jgi:cell division protease FtsH